MKVQGLGIFEQFEGVLQLLYDYLFAAFPFGMGQNQVLNLALVGATCPRAISLPFVTSQWDGLQKLDFYCTLLNG